MRTLHRIGAGILVLAVAGGLAACGDDGDDTSSDTTVPAEDAGALTDVSEDFCSGVVAFNGAVNGVELDETSTPEDVMAAGETLTGPMAQLVDNAPDDLSEQAQSLQSYITPMAEGDATAFNSEDTFAEYSAFLTEAVAVCPFQDVAVTAVDYAFEDVPDTIEAGETAFALANEGAEDHEMIVVRKADGVELTFDEILELSEEESADKVEFKGFGFAPVGAPAGTVLADLDPGEYAMVCFLPVGGAEDGPPHFVEGMKQEFTVE